MQVPSLFDQNGTVTLRPVDPAWDMSFHVFRSVIHSTATTWGQRSKVEHGCIQRADSAGKSTTELLRASCTGSNAGSTQTGVWVCLQGWYSASVDFHKLMRFFLVHLVVQSKCLAWLSVIHQEMQWVQFLVTPAFSLVSQAAPFAERGRVWSCCNHRVVTKECDHQIARLDADIC